MPIKVVIADDHSLVRQGLRRYLEMAGDIQVVGEASNGREVLGLMENGGGEPDIVLLDILMPETFTAREVEVLQLLAFGHTNKDIADQLFISPDTVKTHLEHIFEKLGASDRTAAVAEALRRHLIE